VGVDAGSFAQVYWSSSIRAPTLPLVHSEAWGAPSARIITAAPVTTTRSVATSQSGPGADSLAPAATSRSRMRANRSAATSNSPNATPTGMGLPSHSWASLPNDTALHEDQVSRIPAEPRPI
jgi:hypothetical protein